MSATVEKLRGLLSRSARLQEANSDLTRKIDRMMDMSKVIGNMQQGQGGWVEQGSRLALSQMGVDTEENRRMHDTDAEVSRITPVPVNPKEVVLEMPESNRNDCHEAQSFCPLYLQRHLSSGNRIVEGCWAVDCALVQINVLGVSRIIDAIRTPQDEACRQLSFTMNRFLSIIIETVKTQNGDIIKFNGISATIAFYHSAESSKHANLSASSKHRPLQYRSNSNRGVDSAVLVGAYCANEICDRLSEALPQISLNLPNDQYRDNNGISPQTIISCGSMCIYVAQGSENIWVHTVSGVAIDQITTAARLCLDGRMLCSAEVWQYIKHVASGEVLESGFVNLFQLNTAILRNHIAGSYGPYLESHSQARMSLLHKFVPSGASMHLYDIQDAPSFAEVRQTTVLSLMVNSVEALEALTIRKIQQAVLHQGGNIHSVCIEQKSMKVMITFGTPQRRNLDDESRSLYLWLVLKHHLSKIGLKCSAGISTGKTTSLVVGSEYRREYVIIGKCVRISKRLMNAARFHEMLIDHPTCLAMEEQSNFSAFEPCALLQLRGEDAPMEAFRPVVKTKAESTYAEAEAENAKSKKPPFVGRLTEQKTLQNMFDVAMSQPHGALIVIEGERGIGKSVLANAFFEPVAAMLRYTLYGWYSDQNYRRELLECRTTYACSGFRPMLLELFRDLISAEKELNRESILHNVQDRLPGHIQEYAPLLNAIIPELKLRDTAATLNLKFRAREKSSTKDDMNHEWEEKLMDVVIGALRVSTQFTTAILILDNVEKLDRWSLEIIRRMVCTDWNVGATRHIYEYRPCPILFVMLQRTSVSHIVCSSNRSQIGDNILRSLLTIASELQCILSLAPMLENECKAHMSCILADLFEHSDHLNTNGSEIEKELFEVAYRRSGGNAMFLECVVKDWCKTGLLTFDGGCSKLSFSLPALDRSPIPDALYRSIEAELDILSPIERLTLKTCATLKPIDSDNDIILSFSGEDVTCALSQYFSDAALESALLSLCTKSFLMRIEYKDTYKESRTGVFCFVSKVVCKVCSTMVLDSCILETQMKLSMLTSNVGGRATNARTNTSTKDQIRSKASLASSGYNSSCIGRIGNEASDESANLHERTSGDDVSMPTHFDKDSTIITVLPNWLARQSERIRIDEELAARESNKNA